MYIYLVRPLCSCRALHKTDTKTKKVKTEKDDEYDPYEIKFLHLCQTFWDTKKNKALVTLGKKNTKQNKKEKTKSEVRREYNIETFKSPKARKKKQREVKRQKSNSKIKKARIDSESISYEKPKKKPHRKQKKAGYSSVHLSEEDTSMTRDEETGILILQGGNNSDKENRFSYPSGL